MIESLVLLEEADEDLVDVSRFCTPPCLLHDLADEEIERFPPAVLEVIHGMRVLGKRLPSSDGDWVVTTRYLDRNGPQPQPLDAFFRCFAASPFLQLVENHAQDVDAIFIRDDSGSDKGQKPGEDCWGTTDIDIPL